MLTPRTKKISTTSIDGRDRQVNAAISDGCLLDRLWSEQVWVPSTVWWKRGRYVLTFFAWLVMPPAPAPLIRFSIGPVAERE